MAEEGKSGEAIGEYLILFNQTGQDFPELLFQIGIGGLKNESGMVKNYTLLAIKELKLANKRIVPYIESVLKGKGKTSKVLACEILSHVKDERAITLLYDTLKDKNRRVRIAAAISLLKLGENKAVQTLHKEFSKASIEEKMEIAENGDRSMIPFLQKNLNKKKVKYRAALSLFRLTKDETYVSILKEGLNEKNEKLAMEAALALAELGDRSIIPFLKKKLKSKKKFGFFLIGKRLPLIRIMAIKALAKLGDKSVVPELIKILKSKEKELIIYSPVKVENTIALGIIGDASAIGPLHEELESEVNNEIEKVVICLSLSKILKYRGM